MDNNAENQEHDPATQRVVERHDGPVSQGEPPLHADDLPEGVAPEDLEGEVGAEGGSTSADTPTPFHSHKDDDSPWGSTDQHSKA
jgi:hypothetical protein